MGQATPYLLNFKQAISGHILPALVPRSPLEAMEKGPHIRGALSGSNGISTSLVFTVNFFATRRTGHTATLSQSQDATQYHPCPL
jgi:hypothetical protein